MVTRRGCSPVPSAPCRPPGSPRRSSRTARAAPGAPSSRRRGPCAHDRQQLGERGLRSPLQPVRPGQREARSRCRRGSRRSRPFAAGEVAHPLPASNIREHQALALGASYSGSGRTGRAAPSASARSPRRASTRASSSSAVWSFAVAPEDFRSRPSRPARSRARPAASCRLQAGLGGAGHDLLQPLLDHVARLGAEGTTRPAAACGWRRPSGSNWAWKACASSGFSRRRSTLASTARPSSLPISSSRIGPSVLHGPHQGPRSRSRRRLRRTSRSRPSRSWRSSRRRCGAHREVLSGAASPGARARSTPAVRPRPPFPGSTGKSA